MSTPLVEVKDLVISTAGGQRVLDDISMQIQGGSSVGLVGESGSGKTALAHALLGYARPGLSLTGGSIRIAGEEFVRRSDSDLRELRGRIVSYVPQDPATSLNPSLRIGDQLREICRVHGRAAEADEVVLSTLARVGLPATREFERRFPHQLSGGQQQRVAIGIALCCEPPVIVLDEPTTGLDVITQEIILNEVTRLQDELQVTLIYVSHDLAAVATVAERIVVMYAGAVLETGTTQELIRRPRHPYTRGLVSSIPDHRQARRPIGIPGVAPAVDERPAGCTFGPRCSMYTDACGASRPSLVEYSEGHMVRCLRADETEPPISLPRLEDDAIDRDRPMLQVRGLVARHRSRVGMTTAVDDVSFEAFSGECLALVGESGSGKTTIARCLCGLHVPAEGEIIFDGERLPGSARRRTLSQRQRIQIIFQNPYESLNPRRTVQDSIGWPVRALRRKSRSESAAAVAELLERVRLPAATAIRYPGELSGGERQRVAIARALAAAPDLLICDEVTSALDVSIQAVTLSLLRELQVDLHLAMLFITHDLGVVASVADRVIVLRHGTLQEEGDVHRILGSPSQPYTQRLIHAAPSLITATDSAASAASSGDIVAR